MKKKVFTAIAIAAFVMGGTFIAPNSSNNTTQAKENVVAPGDSMDCHYETGSGGAPCLEPMQDCTCD